MKQFSCMQQEAILRRHGADDEQLPVNLCEPVLMAALGQLMLSDEKAPAPALDQPMRRRLAEQLWGRGAGEIRDALLSVIAPLCDRCGADEGNEGLSSAGCIGCGVSHCIGRPRGD